MATVLTTPREVGRRISDYIAALQSQVAALGGYDRLMRDELTDGTTPLDVKALIDPLMANVNTSIDSISTNLAALVYKAVVRWKAGSPPGVGWLRTGYYSNTSFLTSSSAAMGKQMVLYNDVSPNADLFYQTTGGSATNAIKANDIISVANCSHAANNGRYTIKYDTAAKGNGGSTYGLENGDFASATGWTFNTDWAHSTNKAKYDYGVSGTSPATMTNALTGMSASAAYAVQFDVSYVAGAGTLRVSLGGDYYFEKVFDGSGDSGTFSFITNPASTTPTLTFTAARSSGDFEIDVDNVYVYGAPVLFTVEEFDADVGATEDDSTIITLEQTAA
jgi:hypothetical protein